MSTTPGAFPAFVAGLQQALALVRIGGDLACLHIFPKPGGRVTVPLQQTFWAQRFGEVVDRFGVPWAINCGEREAA